MVIKIVNEELCNLMGSETTEIKLQPGSAITVIMMAGLQGAGKTTTTAKLAGKFKLKARNRFWLPAMFIVLQQLSSYRSTGKSRVWKYLPWVTTINRRILQRLQLSMPQKNGNNLVILDTAGRLHIDEDMMAELEEIKNTVTVHQTILVIDAMTGQDAVNVAKEFDEKIGVDGVIVTKLDGDTRGGAALSVKAVTGKPILYVGMGEKLSDLEQFYPDRMANRILGMGDVLSLIEKAEAELDIDEDKAKEMSKKMKKAQFDFDDYLESIKQMKKLGGLGNIMNMLPGLGGMGMGKMKGLGDEQMDEAEKGMARMEAMIHSMTPAERRDPDLLNPSRKHRIAKGAGVDISEVNRMIKQFNEAKKMMKTFAKPGKKGKFKLPF